MRHYDYDEDEENEDVDKFFEENRNDDEEPEPVYADIFGEEGFVDTDIEMLHIALRMCERSWFWRFRSFKTKLTLVATTYATLKRIL